MPSAAAPKHRSSAPTRAGRSAKPVATSKPASSRRPKAVQGQSTASTQADREARNAVNLARAKAAKGDEVFVFSPDLDLDELTALERRWVEGKTRSPGEARKAFERLAERSRNHPDGITFIGVPDEDDDDDDS